MSVDFIVNGMEGFPKISSKSFVDSFIVILCGHFKMVIQTTCHLKTQNKMNSKTRVSNGDSLNVIIKQSKITAYFKQLKKENRLSMVGVVLETAVSEICGKSEMVCSDSDCVP